MFIASDEIERDNMSSDDEPYDSDKIDSDVEAELYSVIHHQDSSSINISSANNSGIIFDVKNCLSNSNAKESLNIGETSDINQNASAGEVCGAEIENSVNFDSYTSPKMKIGEVKQDKEKRKSDSMSGLINDMQSTSKKQKTAEIDDSSDSSEIIFLSSDDDSDIIWTSPDETNNTFQTNLSGDLQSQNSESDSDDSWCHDFTNDSNNLSSNNKSKDPWFINEEDLYRYKKSYGRYHDTKELNCSNCNQKGHITKSCPNAGAKKCFICGGPHKWQNCRKRICVKCYGTGHPLRYCPHPVFTCLRCKMIGHAAKDCPDLWRKYQLTTTKEFIPPQRLPQTTPLYCYNCGHAGHFGGECHESRMDIRMDTIFYPTYPFVLDYVSPKEGKKAKAQGSSQIPKRNKSKFPMDKFLLKQEFKSRKKSPNLMSKKKMKQSPKLKYGSGEEIQQGEFRRTPKSKILEEQRKNSRLNYDFSHLPSSTPHLNKNQRRRRNRSNKKKQNFSVT